ncbi:2-amino-4-hydroxy-6-hydroxymethyldihydropteridine diphosphokinase [Teredinibacter sp. KSP-S5-2]|uniref:2-amino-4-hydroxy-6- hydroxymethyldihydropteridine diphosphokinase n=1 Tax=Teredinibacter sp. KSP-S5-2 TaxID=3034506 RepID=UPI0029340F9D|nr:2-amino-4-hydroxy-6-hydroxymethyldihydropteridine diphosphokinase [Teredinibacter sp. KSP-S5-2]WNO09464.1 2-amino-4-hydroxy-6-hydroxymethyldihydropteridine diphosphokinase [Teredinibacter sp. KSP-S5-2]
MTNRVISYVGLGSNLANPLAQVEQACQCIEAIQSTQVLSRSPWYSSTAVGPGDQPDYVNGVIKIETELSADSLLDALQSIENQQGRTREIRWGARTLDLDILLYGNSIIMSERLEIPHPRIEERNFVVFPLYDLDSELLLPDGRKVAQLKHQLTSVGITRLT